MKIMTDTLRPVLIRSLIVNGFTVVLLAGLIGQNAYAEKADRQRPVTIESNKAELNDLTQSSVYTGRVILTKGSLILRCDTLTVKQDPEGFQAGTCIGKPASFRQKRDAPNQFIEGVAMRIDYDAKSESAKLTERGVLKRLEGNKVADEVSGSVIVYDGRTELYTIDGKDSERVRIVIQPRSENVSNNNSITGSAVPSGAATSSSANTSPKLKPADKLSGPPR